MKSIKRCLVLIGILSLALLLTSCSGKEYKSGDWGYTLTDEGAVITAYYYQSEELKIPESIDGHTVVGIGDRLFLNANHEVRKLVIPATVKSIGLFSFSTCSALEEVVFEGEIYDIAPKAFEGTPWYNNHDDGIIYIGTYAYAVKGYDLEEEIKEGTTHVQLSGYWDTDKLTIPSSVIKINDCAFEERYIEKLVFADSDKPIEIGKNAFKFASIKEIEFSSREFVLNDGAFWGCTRLTELKLTDNINIAGEGVFQCCNGVKKISVEMSEGSLPAKTFYDCNSVEYVYISEGLEFIGNRAFSNCPGLLEIHIPDSVKRISSNAFWNRERWGEPNVHVVGSEGSYAEIFAHNHKFVFISDKEDV